MKEISLFDKVIVFLQRLEEAKIAYSLKHSRPSGLTVNIDIPGQRWEVDFLDDGDVDVERFVSNGEIHDESMLEELFAENSDVQSNAPARRNATPARK